MKIKIAVLMLTVLIFSCSSNRKMNSFKSKLNCNKTVHFIWDNANNLVKIESIGTYKNDYASFSKGKKIDYKAKFKESLEALNKKYKTKLILVDNHSFPSDSIIQVTVTIDKLVWNKGFSKAVLDNYLIYKTTDQDTPITGISKSQSNARAGLSLLQSFEHGNLLFLEANCGN